MKRKNKVEEGTGPPALQWPHGGLSRQEFKELIREGLTNIMSELTGVSANCVVVINSPGAVITINDCDESE